MKGTNNEKTDKRGGLTTIIFATKTLTLALTLAFLVATLTPALAQTPFPITQPQTTTLPQTNLAINFYYTSPLSSYQGVFGLVYLTGNAVMTNASFVGNFSSIALLVNGTSTQTLRMNFMPINVMPTGSGVYIQAYNVTQLEVNVTKPSGNVIRKETPSEEVLVLYANDSTQVLLKGNISWALPYDDGVFVSMFIGDRSYLIAFQGAKMMFNYSVPFLASPVYYSGQYVLLASPPFALPSYLLSSTPQNLTSTLAQFAGKVRLYELFANGTLNEVTFPVSEPNATYLVLPERHLGAAVVLISAEQTGQSAGVTNYSLAPVRVQIYAFNGSKALLVQNASISLGAPPRIASLSIPFWPLFLENAVITTTLTPSFSVSHVSISSATLTVSSTVKVLAFKNGTPVEYYETDVNGLPLAASINGSSVILAYIKPSVSISVTGIAQSPQVSATVTSTYSTIEVLLPSAIALPTNVSVTMEVLSGQKYVVVEWSVQKGVIANATICVSVNGGPFKALKTLPASVGIYYFPVPLNATNVSVYVSFVAPFVSSTTTPVTLSLASTTTTTTTATTSTTTSTSTTTPPATTSTSYASASSPSPSGTSSPLNLSYVAIGVVVVVVIIAAAALLLRKK
jgi:Predicted solute binding protein